MGNGSEGRRVLSIQLKDAAIITTGKLDANEAVNNGKYPFFTCGAKPLAINEYAFDEDAILLAGNNAHGVFHINRYKGKFNAYQRTYVLTAKDGYDVDFIRYSIEQRLKQLKRSSQGSQTKFLTMPLLESLELDTPPKWRQEQTASVLACLDKATVANRAINDNLHQMIQAIYLHMFFDRKPNARLGDLLIEHPKSTVQVNDAKGFEGAYPFFTSGEAILRWNKPMTTDSICLLNTGGNADVKFYAGAAAYSTDTWCISATNGLTEYLYMLLQTIRKELDIKFFTGTGLKHLQKPLLKERPVYQPTSKEAARFNQIAVPAMALISENIRQNCELQTLRNWLLPMLMNGQATVEATQPNSCLTNSNRRRFGQGPDHF